MSKPAPARRLGPRKRGARPSKAGSLLSAALIAGASVSIPSLLLAHFHMLLPEKPAAQPGETVRIRYMTGHPYEHEVQIAEPPSAVRAYPPEGPPADLAPCPGQDDRAGEARVHLFCYEVPRRGDHVITAALRPALDKERGVIVESHLKVILHSRTQKGWDRAVGQKLEIVPLVRPYGLRPGWVFQAKVLLDGKPQEGVEIEVEKYNDEPPAGDLPEDEFITRTLRTAPGGVLTTSFDEGGWWIIHASVPGGRSRAPDGEEYPAVLSSTLAVYIGEPLAAPR